MFGAGLIEVLPMAALTGLMIMVAIELSDGLV
jgi:MFS superfamily sulfate permease-like transporter